MSWDVSVFAARVVPPPLASMPADFQLESLGTCQDVRDRISSSLPQTDWTDRAWGRFEGRGFTYEFNIATDEPNTGFMIHVRGGGDVVGPLLALAKSTGWFLVDCSEGEWLHHCRDPDAGWHGFQAYRDAVLGNATREIPDPDAPPQPNGNQ
jgi:hypothetical protein